MPFSRTSRARRYLRFGTPALALLLCAGAKASLAQISALLPATPPTAQPATPANPVAATPGAPVSTYSPAAGNSAQPSLSQQPARHAQVGYSAGSLTIAADNSSLNQILREISRQTGMKITGGVNEERVFGVYGPGSASAVLSELLAGTGSNMLLLEGSPERPQEELILTPRQGGPTPPNPNATRDAEEDLPPQLNAQRPPPQRFPPPQGPPGLPPNLPVQQPIQQQQGNGAVNPLNGVQPNLQPNQPPAQTPAPSTQLDPSAQPSPNGVGTPEQIYEQILKLQQQQNKTPPTQTTPQ